MPPGRVVAAERARRAERPLGRAAAADQPAIPAGRQHREFRLTAAEQAPRAVPLGRIEPGHPHVGAPREKRPQGHGQHLVEHGRAGWRPRRQRRLADARARVVVGGDRLQPIPVAREQLDRGVVGGLDAPRSGAARPRSAGTRAGNRTSRAARRRSRRGARRVRIRSSTNASSRWTNGVLIRACIRRCSSTSSICIATAPASSGCCVLRARSSTISRGSTRPGARGRARAAHGDSGPTSSRAQGRVPRRIAARRSHGQASAAVTASARRAS